MPEDNLELFGVLADIDADLQNELFTLSPYADQPRPDKSIEQYHAGFIAGRTAAFRKFRAVARKHGLGWTPGWERPRPQFDIENHLLSDIIPGHLRLEAECSCSNPDSSGSGLVAFYGRTVAQIAVDWHEHVLAEEAKFA